MRISKLLMPAVTLAGALALAGCGGGSSTPVVSDDDEDNDETGTMKVYCNAAKTVEAATAEGCGAALAAAAAAAEQATNSAARVDLIWRAIGGNARVGSAVTSRNVTGDPTFSSGEVMGVLDWAPDRNTNADDGPADNAPLVTLKQTNTVVRAISGWTGAEYAREIKDEENPTTAVFYSALSEVKPKPFAEAYTGDTENPGDNYVPEAAGVPGHLPLTAMRITNGKFTGFRSGPRTQTLTGSVPGTYNGINGRFVCSSTSCPSVSGKPSGTSWKFEPAANAMVTSDPTPYVRFGWWLQEDDEGDWANLATVVVPSAETAADPDGTGRAIVANAWSGKATYEGGAAGQYATDSEAGAFTANATLTADFDDAINPGSISGKLSGFVAGGTSKNWEVDLLKADLGGGDEAAAAFNNGDDGTQWTMDGVKAPKRGEWEGAFHTKKGHASNFDADFVAGTFEAQHRNTAQMRGAFGATEKASE